MAYRALLPTTTSCHHQRVSSPRYPELNSSVGAKWINNLIQNRLGQFNGGHFRLGSILYARKEDKKKYVKLKVRVLYQIRRNRKR
ncbi:hypothetical protein B0H15DRAFT_791708 [Mycena belliarum]|uniref:Uncharacterized protein n=1 Tax=Mycena belliarum TaxID=1033014 RepID=A0AAD6TT87_9AGAR|nr:hypothetical protein B0H15DRAFT_791708 [Mycena belliae]